MSLFYSEGGDTPAESPIQRETAPVTGDRGNPYYAQQLIQARKGNIFISLSRVITDQGWASL